jgi:hypothetical protein
VELAAADRPLIASILNAAWRGAAPAKLRALHAP